MTRLAIRGAGLVAAVAVCLLARPVLADGLGYQGWGVQGGLSSNPDQFVIGMHLDLGEPFRDVRFAPNLDIGFGDDLVYVTVNPDIGYGVSLNGSGTVYFGGAIGLLYWNWDQDPPAGGPPGSGSGRDDDGFELGVAAILGYRFPTEGNPIGVDLKIGITDEYPDLKVMLTYTFLR